MKSLQSKNQDTKVDVHLCGFTLVLCPSYLLRIVDFFTSGLPKKQEPPPPPPPSTPSKLPGSSPNTKFTPTLPPVAAAKKHPAPLSLMTVSFLTLGVLAPFRSFQLTGIVLVAISGDDPDR